MIYENTYKHLYKLSEVWSELDKSPKNSIYDALNMISPECNDEVRKLVVQDLRKQHNAIIAELKELK